MSIKTHETLYAVLVAIKHGMDIKWREVPALAATDDLNAGFLTLSSPVQIYQNLEITLPADGLAPSGAKPSAGRVIAKLLF